jgi:hypothetical protein
MRSRYIPLTIFVVLVLGLFAAAWVWGVDRSWGPDHGGTHVVRVVDDQGQPIGDGNTVIIDRHRGPFFFPFGLLLVPLFFFLLFWTFGRAAWRGGRPNGPNGFQSETPPQWFESWYQQMKRRERENPRATSDTPSQDE